MLKYTNTRRHKSFKRLLSLVFVIIITMSLPAFSVTSAAVESNYWLDVQTLEAGDLGVSGFSGLGYIPDAQSFFTLDASKNVIAMFTMGGELQSSSPATILPSNPLNLAYNPENSDILTLNNAQELLNVGAEVQGETLMLSEQTGGVFVDLQGVENPQGLAFNSDNGNLYILDANGPRIVKVSLVEGANLSSETQTLSENTDTINSPELDQIALEGLAYNPEDGNYYVFSPDQSSVYALNESGALESSYDLSELHIGNLSGMTFAPSTDSTDDPSKMNLFIADSGTGTQDSQVIEVDISATALPEAVLDAALPNTLVNTIDSYLWSPPNTDASGLEYLIADDRLLVTDADIEEPPQTYYAGVNVWESSNTGTVFTTCDTTGFSSEPSGVAADPVSGKRFFADDNLKEIFIVDLGGDGTYCTDDDIVTSFDTNVFGSGDPEGLAYGEGKLFIADGNNAEIYVTDLSGNLLDSWDTATIFGGDPATGLSDPEGIGYHWERNNLFVVSRAQHVIVEMTVDGTVLNTYDFGAYGILNPAGLGIGPSSVDPTVMNVYVSQRGIDNGSADNENDGRIFEIDITPELDLSVTKDDGLTNIRPGKPLTYTIEVTHNGPYPKPVGNILVQDTLPAELINVSWTCSVSGGGTCPANGAGNINQLITLSDGATATFVVNAIVDLAASGTLTNTVTVTTPPEYSELNPLDNSATDNTTIDANSGICGSDPSLVACFPFEEGSGSIIFDSSNYYNDGAVYNSPSWVAGQVDTYALSLNGTNQYGLVPDDATLDMTDAITIAAWIKPAEFKDQIVVKKAVSGATDGYELNLTGTQIIYFRINQDTNGNTYRLNSLSTYPINGTWMHVAATFDGTTMKLYLNGVLNNSMDASTQTIVANTRELMIGAQYAGTSATQLFNGAMDDVRLYNRALSAGEIATLFNGNTPPTASDDSYSTDEDTPLNVAAPGVLGNDNDTDGNPITASLVSDVSNGTLTLNADGSFDYTPDADFNGSDTFTYQAHDGFVAGNTATVTITVNPISDAPVAADNAYNAVVDTTLNVPAPGVLGNDTDADGDTLTAALVADVTNGTLTLNADGSFSYTPNASYIGTDSFTYTANDGTLDSDPATVNINVNSTNTPPVAAADSYSTDEDTLLEIAAPGVLGNDTDSDGDTLTAVLEADVSNGTLTLNPDGSFTYMPNANFNGPDSFTYKANDGLADSNIVTVDLTVNAVNDAPVAVGDTFSTNEDTELNVADPNVLTNDTDAEDDALTAVLVSDVSNGALTLNLDGTFTYMPNADFSGSDSFTYKANDGSLDSNTVTVTITVNPINDAPVAVGDSYATNEDTVLNVTAPGVLGNDSDVDEDTLSAFLVEDVLNGTLNLNLDGSFDYTPDANFNGSDSFTYKANDGLVDSNTVTVDITVNAVNDAPVAVGDGYAVDEDSVLIVDAVSGVLANDSDIEGDPLTAVLISDVEEGILTLNLDGSFTYTSTANFFGSDTFTYAANDGTADGNTVTVTITVNPVPDAPVAVGESYSADEDTELNVAAPGVLGNDTDVDGDILTAVLVSDVSHGGLTLNLDGSFTYMPAADFYGSDSFTYQANDGSLNSNTVTVNLTVNAAPVAVADGYSTDEDTELNVAAPGVLGNDTDAEDDPLTAVLVSDVSNGDLTLNPDGSFSYMPDTDYNGPDSFTYQANDGSLDSNTVTVTITVTAVNDAPVAAGDNYNTDEDTELIVIAPGVLSNDTDAEGNPLTAVLVDDVSNGTLSLGADGSFTYMPNANFNGSDSFTYKANDGLADGNTVTVDITVNAVNDPPVSVNDSYSTAADVKLNVIPADGVLMNDSDVEGNPLSAILVSDVTHGTLDLKANGSFGYTPNAGYNGLDSFTYKANDGTADGNVATVTIAVGVLNDAPVAVGESYDTDEDTLLDIAAPGVLSNDTDADGDPLTAVLVDDATNGTLSLNADGSFTYLPNADFNGSDSFTYRANDGLANSNTVTVNITVNPSADAPAAVGDSYSTDEDSQLDVTAPGVLSNDTDADGDPLTAVLVDDVSDGTLSLNADGSFTYMPDADFNGSDSFTYQANDGSVNSNTVTVSITVNAVNDAPTAVGDSYNADENSQLDVTAPGVLSNDTDIDGNPLTAVLVDDVSNGTLSLNADGSFTYTPDADYNGSDSFTYQANDGSVNSNTVTVTITVNPEDTTPPTISFVTPLTGGTLQQPRAILIVNASDAETAVVRVEFEAYYSGSWHPLGTDNTSADGWRYQWATGQVPDKFVALRATAFSGGGSSIPAVVTGIELTSVLSNGSGYEYREGDVSPIPAQQTPEAAAQTGPVEASSQPGSNPGMNYYPNWTNWWKYLIY